jgi:hypothetical protein
VKDYLNQGIYFRQVKSLFELCRPVRGPCGCFLTGRGKTSPNNSFGHRESGGEKRFIAEWLIHLWGDPIQYLRQIGAVVERGHPATHAAQIIHAVTASVYCQDGIGEIPVIQEDA